MVHASANVLIFTSFSEENRSNGRSMGGKPKVTDLLLNAVRDAAAGNMEGAQGRLNSIRTKHSVAINNLLSGNSSKVKDMLDFLDKHLTDIKDLLRAVSLMRFPHEQMLELVSGYGEAGLTFIACTGFEKTSALNARDVLKFVRKETMT